MSPLDHATDLAKSLVNNHRSFGSYARRDPLPDGWTVVYTSNRDSKALARSNARVIAKALAPYIGDTVETESASHWAVGHVDGFAIKVYEDDGATLTPAFLAYAELALAMADYPVLDDDDFAAEEQDEADETWRNCYSQAERLEYIRDHRSQFDLRCWHDLLGCVRGRFFAGEASAMVSR